MTKKKRNKKKKSVSFMLALKAQQSAGSALTRYKKKSAEGADPVELAKLRDRMVDKNNLAARIFVGNRGL